MEMDDKQLKSFCETASRFTTPEEFARYLAGDETTPIQRKLSRLGVGLTLSGMVVSNTPGASAAVELASFTTGDGTVTTSQSQVVEASTDGMQFESDAGLQTRRRESTDILDEVARSPRTAHPFTESMHHMGGYAKSIETAALRLAARGNHPAGADLHMTTVADSQQMLSGATEGVQFTESSGARQPADRVSEVVDIHAEPVSFETSISLLDSALSMDIIKSPLDFVGSFFGLSGNDAPDTNTGADRVTTDDSLLPKLGQTPDTGTDFSVGKIAADAPKVTGEIADAPMVESPYSGNPDGTDPGQTTKPIKTKDQRRRSAIHQLNHLPDVPAASAHSLDFPLRLSPEEVLSHSPHWRAFRTTNQHHDYNAADIFADTGTVVVSPVDGVVVTAHDDNSPTGARVAIRQSGTRELYYLAHMGTNTIAVHERQHVKGGKTEIGEIGNKHDAENTTPHLHIDREAAGTPGRVICTYQNCSDYNFLPIQKLLSESFVRMAEADGYGSGNQGAAANPAPAETAPADPGVIPAGGGFAFTIEPIGNEIPVTGIDAAPPSLPSDPGNNSGGNTPPDNGENGTPPIDATPITFGDGMDGNNTDKIVGGVIAEAPTPTDPSQPPAGETPPPDTTPPNNGGGHNKKHPELDPGMPKVASVVTEDVVSAMLPGASHRAIKDNYPLIMKALKEFNIDDKNMALYTFATNDAEASGLQPIPEYGRGGGRYRTPNGDYYGRGFIQLTWEGNYAAAGKALGIDLVKHPDKALEPETAARIEAWYLSVGDHDRRIHAALESGDFAAARAVVNGGTNGLDRFTGSWKAGVKAMRQNNPQQA